MKTPEVRYNELLDLLENIDYFCEKHNLRLGQLIEIVENSYDFDLFNIENKELQNYIVDYFEV